VQCGVEAETRTIAGNGERDVTMSDQEIASIYGLPGTVNIYTAGEIKYVGAAYRVRFQCGYWVFGATVFQLDENQPASV
jgi:hypothetical protein